MIVNTTTKELELRASTKINYDQYLTKFEVPENSEVNISIACSYLRVIAGEAKWTYKMFKNSEEIASQIISIIPQENNIKLQAGDTTSSEKPENVILKNLKFQMDPVGKLC
jgi:hypothetical protein